MTATPSTPDAGRTILILANHRDARWSAQLLAQTRGYQHALIVVPATPPASARWIIDNDDAEREARARAASVAGALRVDGLSTRTEVGDADPQQALADALAQHPVDGTVVLGAERVSSRRRHRPRRRFVAAASSGRAVTYRAGNASRTH
jgi:hypothetical protein